jgi:hypothetical protein
MLIILLSIVDISGDYMIALSEVLVQTFGITRLLIIILTPFLISLGFLLHFKCKYREIILIYIFLIIPLYGFINGIFSNDIGNATREFLPYTFILMIPIFLNIGNKNLSNLLKSVFCCSRAMPFSFARAIVIASKSFLDIFLISSITLIPYFFLI